IGVGPSTSLLAAVLAGLIRHPQQIPAHAESLARLQPDDAGSGALLDAMLSLADRAQVLESADLDPILAERGLRSPSAKDYAGMRFGFLTGDGDQSSGELAEAVALLVELPAVEEALAAATQAHETAFSDD
ncbi:MAG: DNA primase, partial [Pseudomonadota bacterium]